MVLFLIHYDTLLQNVTDIITKCDSYFIAKIYASEVFYYIQQQTSVSNSTFQSSNLLVFTEEDSITIKNLLNFVTFKEL